MVINYLLECILKIAKSNFDFECKKHSFIYLKYFTYNPVYNKIKFSEPYF